MNYVMHICHNPKCNNGWIDKDLTNVKTNPPAWKYCKECCQKLGIDFEKQKPSDYMSEAEINMRRLKVQKSKEARLLKINSTVVKRG